MPDWSREIRAAIASLNLDPAREAEVVEELSQHLRDRYTRCWLVALLLSLHGSRCSES